MKKFAILLCICLSIVFADKYPATVNTPIANTVAIITENITTAESYNIEEATEPAPEQTGLTPEETATPSVNTTEPKATEPAPEETTEAPADTEAPTDTTPETTEPEITEPEVVEPEETTAITETIHTCSFGAWSEMSTNICTSEKTRTRVCECGEVEVEIIPATPHTYSSGMCAVCGFAEKDDENHTHNFGEWSVVKNTTCTIDGIKSRSCSCGITNETLIIATGHKETTIKGKTSTCAQTGLTEGTKCSVCNVVLVKQKTLATTPHTIKNGVCIVCGADPVVISPALPEIEKTLVAPTKEDFGEMLDIANKLYNAILSGEKNCTIDFSGITAVQKENSRKEFEKTFSENVLCGLDIWHYEFVSGAWTQIITDIESTREEYARLNEYRNVVVSLGITDGMSKMEACKLINDYICENTTYEWYAKTTYDAFVRHKANCEGYACLFIAICDRAGIEAGYMEGRTKQDNGYGYHAWNTVFIGQKLYYNDVCWNDSTTGKKNRYFMSETLWDDHTDDLDINITLPNTLTTETVKFEALPKTIADMMTAPTREIFGEYYEYAITVYNGILNGNDTVELIVDCTNCERYPAVVYGEFNKLFAENVLNARLTVKYSASWNYQSNKIGRVIIDTANISAVLSEQMTYAEDVRSFNIEAGVYEGQNKAEAIAHIINHMCNKLSFEVNCYIANPDYAVSMRVTDERLYAPIFVSLCEDAGIKAETVVANVNEGGKTTRVYFNRIMLNGKEYYTNMWHYFTVSHKGYKTCTYKLSDTLWSNYTLK